jgi:hypothetical protein
MTMGTVKVDKKTLLCQTGWKHYARSATIQKNTTLKRRTLHDKNYKKRDMV